MRTVFLQAAAGKTLPSKMEGAQAPPDVGARRKASCVLTSCSEHFSKRNTIFQPSNCWVL
jgi:hypothetical protein